VFINCPFDAAYAPLLDAIVFGAVCAGFWPRMAQSSGDVATPRLDRILDELLACRYSIHDLSRWHGEGPDNLARFNMPLELGMAVGIRGRSRGRNVHQWMAMVPDDRTYQRVVSDLAGFDLKRHDGEQRGVLLVSLAWLVAQPDAAVDVEPDEVAAKLPAFVAQKRRLAERWGLAEPPRGDIVDVAAEVAEDRGL
jgi:hypothetical protein